MEHVWRVFEMKAYKDLSVEELKALKEELDLRFEEVKNKRLKLDMSRGKPSMTPIDLMDDILTVLVDSKDCIVDNIDSRID